MNYILSLSQLTKALLIDPKESTKNKDETLDTGMMGVVLNPE